MFTNYVEAEEYYNNNLRRVRNGRIKVCNNTYLSRTLNGYVLILHSTAIIVYRPNVIRYNTGGHYTRTTKQRMTKFSPYTICSQQWNWYIYDWKNKITLPFYPKLPLPDSGLESVCEELESTIVAI